MAGYQIVFAYLPSKFSHLLLGVPALKEALELLFHGISVLPFFPEKINLVYYLM
jgi:hypothetical protein